MCLVYWEGRMGCIWFIGRVGWGVFGLLGG